MWARRAAVGTAILLYGAAASAADLTIGLNVTPTSMDPHFHYVSQNSSPLSHVLETLVAMEGDRSLSPALATSWKAIDDTTWEFNLRKGVKFTTDRTSPPPTWFSRSSGCWSCPTVRRRLPFS
jgi:peptide/nickel transport system substrate-binding protein